MIKKTNPMINFNKYFLYLNLIFKIRNKDIKKVITEICSLLLPEIKPNIIIAGNSKIFLSHIFSFLSSLYKQLKKNNKKIKENKRGYKYVTDPDIQIIFSATDDIDSQIINAKITKFCKIIFFSPVTQYHPIKMQVKKTGIFKIFIAHTTKSYLKTT